MAQDTLQDTVADSITNNAVPVTQVMADQVLNPTLPAGTELTPVLQTEQPGEQLQTSQVAPTGASITDTATIQAPVLQTATADTVTGVSQEDALRPLGEATTVTPLMTNPIQPLQGVMFNMSDEASVANQLADLYADTESGQIPTWAKGAYNQATEIMAARGLPASSIAAGAIVLAMQQSALPIATADANTYFQRDLAQFNADQQTALVNFQARQQNMLTDVSIANAARNFNASSKQQQQQFTSSLITQIQTTNANLLQATEQFNANQENVIAAQNAGNYLAANQFNIQQQQEVKKFNSQLQTQRELWNAENQAIVNQSNVEWRRGINTSNTAAINAANQVNVMNKFNMSQNALNNLNMEYRDNAAWAFEASQRAEDKAYNLAVISGNRDFITDFQSGQSLGGLFSSIFVPAAQQGLSAGISALTSSKSPK